MKRFIIFTFMIKTIHIILLLSALMILASCEECKFESISTEELPMAHIQQEYYAKITTKQTCPAFAKYCIIKEGSLPDGFSINDDGEIKGIPIRQGIWKFTVLVEICFAAQNGFDADCHWRTAGFSIEVLPY